MTVRVIGLGKFPKCVRKNLTFLCCLGNDADRIP
jgi:hypothetical protein